MTFPPAFLRIHVPAKPMRSTAPSKRVSDKREGVHSLLASGSRAPLPPPCRLPPFPASCSSGIRPPTPGPLEGHLSGCIGSRRPPAGPRGSRGAQAAFPRGPRRAGAAVQGSGRRAGGARGAHLSHAVPMAGDSATAGGGGVVSEAHSTLIHKVGNTTPSSAVSSAFYFMGDCTVCLSVCGALQAAGSSSRLQPDGPPALPLRPETPAPCPLAWHPACPGPVGGDSAWRQTGPPSPHFLFGSLFPSPPTTNPAPPHRPHIRGHSGGDRGHSGGLTLVPGSDPWRDALQSQTRGLGPRPPLQPKAGIPHHPPLWLPM